MTVTALSSEDIKLWLAPATAGLPLSYLLASYLLTTEAIPSEYHSILPLHSGTGYKWEEQLKDAVYFIDEKNQEILEKATIIHEFASKLIENSEDLDPDYARIVSEKFWDLI